MAAIDPMELVTGLGLNMGGFMDDFSTSMDFTMDFDVVDADAFVEGVNQFGNNPLCFNSDDDDDRDELSLDHHGSYRTSEEYLFGDDEEFFSVHHDRPRGRRQPRQLNSYQYKFFDVTQASWYRQYLTRDNGMRDRTYYLSQRDRFGTFRAHFRMPLRKVDKLVDMFLSQGWIKYSHHCRSPTILQIKAELLILSCLNILAHGTPFRALESSTNISYSEIRKFFHFFLDKMCSIQDEFIYLPRDEEELNETMEQYESVGLPGCIGSIDVVHIKWSNCPAGDFNRSKGKESYPSVAFEVVTDHERKIMGVSRGHFGTRNDKHIVKTDKNVKALREDWYRDVIWHYIDKYGDACIDSGVYYICDNGYCRWPVTICPYKHQSLSTPEGEWSDNLESVRKDVECCFGIMKKRWRILDHGLKFRSLRTCEKIFICCCILHNMMLNEAETNPPRANRGNGPYASDGLWIEGPSDMIPEDMNERSESTMWGLRRNTLVHHFMKWSKTRG